MQAIVRALGAWWQEVFTYALLNLVWVGSFFTIIGIPPATAAMYQMARHSADRDSVSLRAYFQAIVRLLVPAWKWMLLQVVVYGIIVTNLVAYAFASGTFWDLLRVAWMLGLVLWTIANLFYWSFYFMEDDRRILNTYRNVYVMCLRNPLLVMTMAVWSVLVVLLSTATAFMLAFAVMALVALSSTFAVQYALE